MSSMQRQNRLMAILERRGGVEVADAARELGVSTMTIRRDLAALEAAGSVIRTHGGAVPAGRGVVEFRFDSRHRTELAAKQAIAAEAAALLGPGLSVLLDTGTTTLEIAQAIRFVPGLRVVTTSLAIAAALYAQQNIELILLGGTVRTESPDLSGPLTEENLSGFHADVAFLGADGVGPEGLYTDSVAVARLSRGMIRAAERVIVAVDHTKFARRAFRRYAAWDQVDQVITDEGIGVEVMAWLERLTTVCVAGLQ